MKHKDNTCYTVNKNFWKFQSTVYIQDNGNVQLYKREHNIAHHMFLDRTL